MQSKPTMSNAIAYSLSPTGRARVSVPGTTLLLATALLLAVLVAIASAQESTTTDDTATRDHLANLSTTEKEELRRKRDQFQQLDDVEKKRLRDLHSSIASSPDRDRLEATMLQYHEWLKSLPGKERADLLKLPPEEKIAEIKRLMQEQRSQQFRKLVATPPEPNDVRGIFEWFDSYVEAHEAELMAMLSESMQSRIRQVTIDSARRKMLAFAAHQTNPDGKFPTPTGDDLRKLNERLSPKAREALAQVTDPEEKLKVVQGWLRAAMASRMMLPQVSHERLLSFYREQRDELSKLDPKKVEELEALPPEAFYQEVRSIYFRQRGPWRGGHRQGDDRRDGPWHNGHDDRRGDGDHRRHDRDDRGPDGDGSRRPRPEGRPPPLDENSPHPPAGAETPERAR